MEQRGHDEIEHIDGPALALHSRGDPGEGGDEPKGGGDSEVAVERARDIVGERERRGGGAVDVGFERRGGGGGGDVRRREGGENGGGVGAGEVAHGAEGVA